MKNGKYCILIADDEKEIRDILRLLLEGEGYAVLTAEDGREAIAEAAAEVDLYILDVNMPEVSGFPAAAAKPPRSACCWAWSCAAPPL